MGRAVPSGLGGFHLASREGSMAMPGETGGRGGGHGSNGVAPARMGLHGTLSAVALARE